MDARPTPEQRELTEAAERLARKLGPSTVGDLDDAERRDRLDAAVDQAGWRQLRSGERDEPVASGVEAALVARAFAQRSCDTSFVGPVLAEDLLRRAGLLAAEATTIALAPDLSGLAVAGQPGVAIDAAGSTRAIGLDASGTTLVAWTLPEGDRGGIDLTRPATNLPADAETVALGPAPTADDLASWTALAVTLTAADLVGSMDGAIELTAEYAKQRRQYGAAIGSYQAVQHLLAEAFTLADGSLSTLFHAAWAVDELAPGEALAAAAVAKAYTGRAARTVCETAIQVHGGIGNTWECMAHVFLRRALLSTALFGDDSAHLAALAARRWGGPHGLS